MREGRRKVGGGETAGGEGKRRMILGKLKERRKIYKCKMCPLDLHFHDLKILFVF